MVEQTVADRTPLDFEDFFRRERPRLYRALVVITRDSLEAEEVTQQAFCSVWEHWNGVSTIADPVGYLYRTALNRRFQVLRRAAVAVRKQPRVSESTDPLSRVEAAAVLEREFLALTIRQRAALVLTAGLSYSSSEAAAIMGVRPGTVRRLASQAMHRLRTRAERSEE